MLGARTAMQKCPNSMERIRVFLRNCIKMFLMGKWNTTFNVIITMQKHCNFKINLKSSGKNYLIQNSSLNDKS